MHFGERLRQERLHRHLSQEALAEALGTSARSVARWEQGQAFPHASARLHLSRFFGVSPAELFDEQKTGPSLPDLWSVPSTRNPFFTGREELLEQLQKQLQRHQSMALTHAWALSGLGGIGKTQLALEYAYRYRQHYRFVFWTSAATRETLLADLLNIAQLLGFPQRANQEQEQVLRAVKQWFASHEGWLWILDNADDIEVVREVLPAERPGHLLLTTRAQALGTLAQRLEVETMGIAEATLFLLRRARLLAPDAFLDQMAEEPLAAAEAIALDMDFLPLALDQAGAYIEEVGCSPTAYLELYRRHRKELLERRGHTASDHPDSVATTWSLSFERLAQQSPAAADLLHLYAFLEPDAIPLELLSEGSVHLSLVLQEIGADPLALNDALEALRRFSLIQRHADSRMLSIHRLVQVVLKDVMSPEVQRQWAERAVRAVNAVFPVHVEVATWLQCRRYLPQAQACSALIQDYAFTFEEAASLLFRTAAYLQVYSLYEQAEPLYQRALRIHEQNVGPEHPDLAATLNKLAGFYFEQARDEQAEELYQRALHIYEQTHGSEPPDLATTLNGLAILYKVQGRYEQAEPLYQRALRIREQMLGSEHPDVGTTLNNLATLYKVQGRYEQAEPLYQRALRIREQARGPEHPDVATTLNNLANLYTNQARYEQAEPLYQRALHIQEQILGLNHPDVAMVLGNLADLYLEQGRYEQAEPMIQRTIHIWEQSLGSEHPNVAFALATLADLFFSQGRYEQAEALYQRILRIREQALSPDHPDIAEPIKGLANIAREQGQLERAELLYQRALHILEQAIGSDHPDIAETLDNFALLRQAQGNNQEAASLYQRALLIREQVFGPEHPKTVRTRLAYMAALQAHPQIC